MANDTCSVDGCVKSRDARGLCQAHYKAARKRGDFGGTPCSIEGCDAITYSRGWCKLHYDRWRTKGDATWQPPTDLESFLARILVTPSGCWEWTGSRTSGGYGLFSLGDVRVYAHRWSYEHHKGPIPDGFEVDHLCRNTPCANPEHLEAVTPRVNNLRSESPAAQQARKTECLRGHPFDEENTAILPGGGRRCRRCHRERERARQASHRVDGRMVGGWW